MGGSFSRGIKGSFSGRERASKGFEEIRGESEFGPRLGEMGGPRGEEEGGAAEVESLRGAEGGVGIGMADLGGATSECAFGPAVVFFFLTVSHCSLECIGSSITNLEQRLEKWPYS